MWLLSCGTTFTTHTHTALPQGKSEPLRQNITARAVSNTRSAVGDVFTAFRLNHQTYNATVILPQFTALK